MIVTYEPEQSVSGIVSSLSWNNPDLHEALKRAFRIKSHERITHIEISREGIKAVFELDQEATHADAS